MAPLLVAGIVAGLIWAVKPGQLDDMEGPAYQILMAEVIYPEKGNEDAKRVKIKGL